MDTLAAEIPKILSIFALAFFTFWTAIAAGIALGLPPLVVILVTTLSYSSGAALVTLFGDRVRDWLTRRRNKNGDQQEEQPESAMQARIRRIAERYGALGLGLASPMTLGSQLGSLLGIALNIPPRRLFLGMVLGALAWSIVLTLITVAGVAGVQSLSN